MEGDAGASRLNPTHDEQDHTPEDQAAPDNEEFAEQVDEVAEPTVEEARRPTRIGRGWAVVACAVLLLLAAGAGVGGYLALQSHRESETIARNEEVALRAAKDCVAATQAPDTAAMLASQTKIIECATGEFGAQAAFYSGMLPEAYQAANVTVQVADMRAAVEKHYDDGSMDVLVAVRVRVTNVEAANQELGFRLRARMAPEAGTYKVYRLDQVAS